MKKYKIFSPAKINLTLEIIDRLPDGFHLLRSLVYKTENLKDEIELIVDEKKRGIKIICNDKNIPTDKRNICWKIAEEFFRVSGKSAGLTIKIKKNIPALAGLGGGSSNGAAVLQILNKHFNYVLKNKKLINLAGSIGKDIPLFLFSERAVMMTGAGEKISIIKNFPKLNLLIVNPQGEIGTAWAYGELDKRLRFMNDKRRKNITRKTLKCMQDGRISSGVFYNDFDFLAEELFPVIKELKNCLLALGATSVSITGKGPTVVGLFKSKKELFVARGLIREKYPKFFVRRD
ncbi:MAG: 4-(cytidine 5'-diphospho)-2-C-methyl-D-erythritol kinase [Candidatus Moraniibacteriota bacterium]